MDKMLSQIIEMCWEDYVKYKKIDNSPIVKPSIPILWFGNLTEYQNSPQKILTIAINPSSDEFRINKDDAFNFIRFKEGEKLYNKEILNDDEIEIFINTLNAYYTDEPYTKWFKRLEFPLNCINTSYGGKLKNGYFLNTAIHIDLCPLATTLKWGELPKDIANQLKRDSKNLLNSLLSYLKPDIIVASISKKDLKDVFGIKSGTKPNREYKNDKCGFIRKYNLDNIELIVGRNMVGTPFGAMTNEFIKEKMEKLKEEMLLNNKSMD